MTGVPPEVLTFGLCGLSDGTTGTPDTHFGHHARRDTCLWWKPHPPLGHCDCGEVDAERYDFAHFGRHHWTEGCVNWRFSRP